MVGVEIHDTCIPVFVSCIVGFNKFSTIKVRFWNKVVLIVKVLTKLFHQLSNKPNFKEIKYFLEMIWRIQGHSSNNVDISVKCFEYITILSNFTIPLNCSLMFRTLFVSFLCKENCKHNTLCIPGLNDVLCLICPPPSKF